MSDAGGHDVLLVDLDGTVYLGPDPVDGAVEALEAARKRGVTLSYVTNNASRSPSDVAEHLTRLGLTLDVDDVVTSAQAAAALVAERFEPGSAVLVVGTEALADEVREVGLNPVRKAADEPVAVVQGHSPDTGWRVLAEATTAIGRGAAWVACNVDPTLPSEGGALLPGNGAMVAALRTATKVEPDVAGKPAPPLLRQAVERAGAKRPLSVGDRLDTDMAGARSLGIDGLLVLTGVSTPADAVAATPDQRPTHLGADLSVLDDIPAAAMDAPSPWRVRLDDGVLRVTHDGDGDADRVAALRAVCVAAWAGADDGGERPGIQGDDDAARDALQRLGLGDG